MSGSDLMLELGKGNPGALSVVAQLNYTSLQALKIMGITGSLIWIGYKDICKEDIKEFEKKIADRSIKRKIIDTPDYKYMKKEGLI